MSLLSRPRIAQRLFASQTGVTFVIGGAGFGKSVAVQQFLAENTRPALAYEVRSASHSFVGFIRGFVDAASRTLPGLQTSFPGAIEYAMQAAKPHEEIALWLLDHLKTGALECIAIEDVHNVAGDERVALLLERLIEKSAPSLRWILASRDERALPMRLNDAGISLTRIDEADLRLEFSEAREIARSAGLSDAQAHALFEATRGWPAAFHLGAHVAEHGSELPRERIYEHFAQRYFARCSQDLQAMLMGTCVLGEVDEELLSRSPWGSCIDDVRELARKGLIFSARGGFKYAFHELFRDFLRERIGPAQSGGRRSAMVHGGSLLERCGRYSEALEMWQRAEDVPSVFRALEEHGFELVDQGRLDIVRRAIALVGEEQQHQSAVLLALRAIDESQAGRSDTSESWYLHALEIANEPQLRATIAYRYAMDLIRQGRADSIALLEPHVKEQSLPPDLAAFVRSTLATAYVVGGRFDDARTMIGQALRLTAASGNISLHAKIYQHAAWVALFTGEVASARQHAMRAIDLALSCGLYDIAARAYSVLYNVHYDLGDDARASLEVLNKIWDCGLKAGDQRLRLYALLGSFDIAAELGDTAQLNRIERTLEAYEVDFADPATSETLLPGQALRLAASGDFKEAYRLLNPTGERQITGDRRALRFAEIGLYAAAAGFYVEASAALEEAQSRLDSLDPSARRTMRTKAVLAVALYLTGRSVEAKMCLRSVSATHKEGSIRVRALIETLEVLFSRWEDQDDYVRVLDALSTLHFSDFGGIAAVLAALPHRPLVKAS